MRGVSQTAKIRNVKKLKEDIEDESIITDQLQTRVVCDFGKFVALALVATHKVSNLDLCNEDEEYDCKNNSP